MELVVDKCIKLDKPFMSDLQSTQPSPIEVTERLLRMQRWEK
jgi:hypothetical protein